MIVVDTAVLTRLRSNVNLHVFDGLVLPTKDPDQPVRVNLPMPYINYTSAVGDDDNYRLAGRRQRRSVPFWLMYVGLDREQAKGAGEAARELLEGWLASIENHNVWRCKLEESQRIRRDDDALNPDGKPLFYGVDAYAISMQLALSPAI